MCKKQDKIDSLEEELRLSHKREADLFKTLSEARKFNAEEKNFSNQIAWRPVQVAMIPILLGLISIVIAVSKS